MDEEVDVSGYDVAHFPRLGKWSEPGVPHKGWTLNDVIDLGEDAPRQICEMCEAREIRYVHFVTHPDYEDELEVGCVCACHMTQDYVTPREREKALRRKSARRRSAKATFDARVRRLVALFRGAGK